MKRLLFVLIVCGLSLLPQQRVLASPQYLEAEKQIEAHQPVATETVDLKGQTELELEYTHLPNPCLHGCGYAEANCTQWAAIIREGLGVPVGDSWGNAAEWPSHAEAEGVPTGDHPRVGAVAISQSGYYGHAMVVKAINPDGSFIVTEQNYDYMGSIRERRVPNASGLIFIYY